MDETFSQTVGTPVDLDQILADLDHCGRRLPVEAIRAAREHREQIIPRLIEAIRQATADARAGKSPSGDAYFLALFLLTEFRAKEALPAILETVSLPDRLSNDMYGDAVTETLPRILAALADDRLELVDELIRNSAADQFVRWSAAETYRVLAREGRITRDEAVRRLREHLRDAIEKRDAELASSLVCSLCDCGAREALPEIEEAIRLELGDEFIMDLDEARECLEASAGGGPEAHAWRGGGSIDDTIQELTHWAKFRGSAITDKLADKDEFLDDEDEFLDDDDEFPDDDALDRTIDRVLHAATLPVDHSTPPDYERPFSYERPEPIRRAGPRVGRNEPCPCGSGKKYKKCCGARH